MTELRHEDIRWRVSNTWDKGAVKWGMLVGYIDARTCMDALDALDANWGAVHGDPIVVGQELIGVPCTLTVNGVSRSDVGMPSSQEPIKGAYSDALKRAAVHFGIGRELYELPKIAVECEVGNNGKVKAPKALPFYRNGRWDIDRKLGWVIYDREPDEERPAKRQPASEPSLRHQILDALAAVGKAPADAERYADEVGVPKGELATDDQLRAILALIQQPAQDERQPTTGGVPPVNAAMTPEPASQPSDGSVTADGARSEPAAPPSSGAVRPAPATPATSQEAADGPLAPDRDHDPDEYRTWFEALPSEERAKIRAKGLAPVKVKAGKVEQQTINDALGAPESDAA